MTRRIAAHYVFPVSRPPIAKGIIEANGQGMILRLIVPENGLREMAGMEFHNGILCPAFGDISGEFTSHALFESFPLFNEFKKVMPSQLAGYQGVLEWMKAIQRANSKVSLDDLIRLFSLETARVLGCQDEMGTLDPGKRPGILLIDRMDYRNLKLSPDSRVKRLI
jgi:hypothetical protein